MGLKMLFQLGTVILLTTSYVIVKGDESVDNSDFMPSHQVLFRRNDGELLLPALSPYVGNLQTSAQNLNSAYSRPSYGAPTQEVVCLLRTCDQYITGRDLTYQRALEIVQNEEYLVAVDADLIRRRQDYGGAGAENFGTSWDLLNDHVQLTKYLATAGKKKKREAEENPLAAKLTELDPEMRIFNISGTGYGTVNYDWTSVVDQYLKMGAATALLFGLASYLPAPSEPILPVTLSSLSKNSETEGDLVEKSIYQVYQEDAPDRVDRLDKIPDSTFMKRFDLLAAFRPKNKRPKKRPSKRPGQAPASILKPVTNTQKRQVEKKKVQEAPKLKDPEVTKDIKVGDLDNGELDKNPFLTELEFKEFFPSWSDRRKKRATVVTEGRIFNITSSGFGTVTYDWRDVINTYAAYFVTGGLILAVASMLTVPAKPLIPLDLPQFGDARINPTYVPPNLPEGLVPPGNPLPGTPGGGARPVGNSPDAREAIALVPTGTIPVAIFPPFATQRTVPAVAVIFLETATPGLVKRQGLWDLGTGFDSLSKSYNCMKAKYFRKKRSPSECQQSYDHLRYGFRTRVALVENQSCILDVTCTSTGDRINVALSKRRNTRQTGEEFQSDAPPSCRAVRDPSNTCRNYLAA